MKAGDWAYVLAVITMLGASIWTWTSGPCGLWTFSKVGDMPARCITHQ
ncbi:hypothetical protein ACF1AX_21305 [Streptomyces sp. NPDC014802]|nr:hypothetical protein SEA_BOWDEN_33 [Streptomyces phage Bowden]